MIILTSLAQHGSQERGKRHLHFCGCPLSSILGAYFGRRCPHLDAVNKLGPRLHEVHWSMQKSARTVAPAYQEFYIDRYE
jgi:hypothetical protein